MNSSKKGFTLIELLIVIGILAVLATITVLVLNPAELFRQARDSQRLADLDAVQGAITFTVATDSTPPTFGTTAQSTATPSTQCNSGANAIYSTTCTLNALRAINGTGWVGVDLTGAAGGSPLAQLPTDPTNDGTRFYAYKGNSSGQFKLGAVLESTRYTITEDKDGADGGTASGMYELGTILTAF